MPEGVDAGIPKEQFRPERVVLRAIEAGNPQDVARYTEIDQQLDPEKWETARMSPSDVEKEIREHAAVVPFKRKDEEPDFYLFGVSESKQGHEAGKLLGFVSTYEDEYIDRIMKERNDIAAELGGKLAGKNVAEIAFARHGEATSSQMVDGIHLTVNEIVREYKERTGKSVSTLVVTSYVQDELESERALVAAGFNNKGTFDLRDEGETEPDEWVLYAYTPTA